MAEPEPRDRLRLGMELAGVEALPGAVFTARAYEAGLTELRIARWPTSAKAVPAVGERIVRTRDDHSENVVFGRDGLLVQVILMAGFAHVTVAGTDAAKVEDGLASVRELLPAPDPSSRQEVPVTFWTYGPHGPQPAWRSIAVPEWTEIEKNYPRETKEALVPLMRGFEPARGGQLLLWHGEPGTGKTYALRALAWEWREWCRFHYIVDPDRFFGEHADYLLGVLLGEEGPGEHDAAGDELELDLEDAAEAAYHVAATMRGGWVAHGPSMMFPGAGRAAKPWMLLMLEDAGDLLSAEARALVGQALSRFLNVVDGLIGQGLRVLVLVTTNEEIRRLHPAVARPGRAAANVSFTPLGTDEANAWLEARGVPDRVASPTSLATLYALAEGLAPGADGVFPGFGG